MNLFSWSTLFFFLTFFFLQKNTEEHLLSIHSAEVEIERIKRKSMDSEKAKEIAAAASEVAEAAANLSLKEMEQKKIITTLKKEMAVQTTERKEEKARDMKEKETCEQHTTQLQGWLEDSREENKNLQVVVSR